MAAISAHGTFFSGDLDYCRRYRRHVERCLEAAEILECPVVVVASGGKPDIGPDGIKLLADDLTSLAEKAMPHGVCLALEAHRGELVQHSYEAAQVLDMVSHPNLGSNFDPWHFELLGEDLGAAAATLVPWIIHTHLHDVPRETGAGVGSGDPEAIPGDGRMDWETILSRLQEADYSGAYTVELHRTFSDRISDHIRAREFLEGSAGRARS